MLPVALTYIIFDNKHQFQTAMQLAAFNLYFNPSSIL